jgi:hypothetical protein
VEKNIPDPPDGISEMPLVVSCNFSELPMLGRLPPKENPIKFSAGFLINPSSTWLGLACSKELTRVVGVVLLVVVAAVVGLLGPGVVILISSWPVFPSVVKSSSIDADAAVDLDGALLVVLTVTGVSVVVEDLGLPVVEGKPEVKLTPKGLKASLFCKLLPNTATG